MVDEPKKVEPKIEDTKPNLHVPEYSAENPPKNKAEWQNLKESDPVKWGDLTQSNMDSTFRQNKELEEKASGLEGQLNNVTAELNKYKAQQQKEVVTEKKVTDSIQAYSKANLPKTKDEWDDLAIDDPILAVDLRQFDNNQRVTQQTNFQSTLVDNRKTVQVEHPDMYLPDVDSSGQPKKDENGNIVRLKDANGELIFNPKSEKGKIFETIYNEDPTIGSSKNAPTLLMAEMERRLRSKGQQVVNSDSTRQQQITDGQVIHDGLPPPVNVKVEFKSEEEKESVDKGIARGLWKDAEEYCQARDGKSAGFTHEGRMPDFNKK